jgi:ferrous iron transport protein A
MSNLADLALAGAPLDTVPNGVEHVVACVSEPAEAPHWARWLQELGFLPGEPVSVRARGLPGGEPLVVRVGTSTFALRRAEAACIRVVPR